MQKRRILIVDDEQGLVRLLKLTLERTGRYEVLEESDATKALEVAVEFKPELVLLDLVMPKIDGGRLALQIRADPQVRQTPILFLSATVLKREGWPTEIDGIPALAKPIGVAELLDAIEANLPEPVAS